MPMYNCTYFIVKGKGKQHDAHLSMTVARINKPLFNTARLNVVQKGRPQTLTLLTKKPVQMATLMRHSSRLWPKSQTTKKFCGTVLRLCFIYVSLRNKGMVKRHTRAHGSKSKYRCTPSSFLKKPLFCQTARRKTKRQEGRWLIY